MPVDIADVDPADAIALARPAAVGVATALTLDVDDCERLAKASAQVVADGSCAAGLTMDKLRYEAGLGRTNRVADRFSHLWHRAADLTVRALCTESRHRVYFERVVSVPVEVARSNESLGTDKLPGAHKGLTLIGVVIGASDRETPCDLIELTTGTRDDRRDPRADQSRIARFERQLGGPPPASVGEHVDVLLTRRAEGGRLVRAAAARHGSDSAVARLAAHGRSRYTIVGPLAVGPPARGRLSSGRLWPPGADDEVIEVLRAHGRLAVAWGGALEDGDTPVEVRDGDLRGAGFLLQLGVQLPAAYRLGIHPGDAHDVEYWYRPADGWLARRQSGRFRARSGMLAEQYVRTDFWRVVGLEHALPRAMALVERHALEWPHECIDKFERRSCPGRIQASTIRSRRGLVALTAIGNAAVVAAHRRAYARHARA